MLKRLLRNFCKYSDCVCSPKVLITGSQGQIGTELITLMREKYGGENVVATDIRLPEDLNTLDYGPYHFLDVNNKRSIENLIEEYDINWIVHMSAFLSAASEIYTEPALALNTNGLHNVLDCAEKYDLKCFVPSSIAAFGPTTPLDATPDITSQRPRSIYGVGKVYAELLGEYYHAVREVDFTSIRYPGVLSYLTIPSGGTTDYSVDFYYAALKGETYECYIDHDVSLPMIYMPDCLKATIDLLEENPANLTQRTYNVQGMAFSPKELELAIQKHVPDFKVVYKPDQLRNGFAKSWPNDLDDSIARADWGWKEDYDIDAMTEDMLNEIAKILEAQ